ncbi:MAG TPA: hypothetical protein DCZ92_09470 [Elusimicrobia bacterium]|nr:MAG: hypothetical protein A2016_11425 [Elusimicrobia bacterium GWF2_62_30]HBA61031.1 hypothetical protein [Elusimicrobiota bacterium]
MTSLPLLTFAIPTYNGAEYLKGAIDSILNEVLAKKIDDIEILISDNCSRDATGEISEKYQAQYPGLVRYRRNAENAGYDRNVDLAIRAAKGEYVWLIGDDDYLSPDAVSVIRAKVLAFSDPKPAACIAPADHYNMVRKEMVYAARPAADKVYPDGNSFFQSTMWATSSMASVIVRRADWERIDLADSYGSQWVHLAGLIRIMRNRPGIVLSSPPVIVRIRNPRWQGNFGNQLWAGVSHLDTLSRLNTEGYSPEIFDEFIRQRVASNLMAILTLKPSDLASKVKIAKGMAHYLYKYPVFWLIHLPALLFIPNLPRVKRALKKMISGDYKCLFE